jgi:hypothetical protein
MCLPPKPQRGCVASCILSSCSCICLKAFAKMMWRGSKSNPSCGRGHASALATRPYAVGAAAAASRIRGSRRGPSTTSPPPKQQRQQQPSSLGLPALTPTARPPLHSRCGGAHRREASAVRRRPSRERGREEEQRGGDRKENERETEKKAKLSRKDVQRAEESRCFSLEVKQSNQLIFCQITP